MIRPVDGNRLVLAALDERGVFYAALTLRQLLESRFAGETVTLPLAVVTDWPDLAERGEWGTLTRNSAHTRPEDIELLSACKMNLQEFHCPASRQMLNAPDSSSDWPRSHPPADGRYTRHSPPSGPGHPPRSS